METELSPSGWLEGEAAAENVPDDGSVEAEESEMPLAVEETAVSDVKLFNKW